MSVAGRDLISGKKVKSWLVVTSGLRCRSSNQSMFCLLVVLVSVQCCESVSICCLSFLLLSSLLVLLVLPFQLLFFWFHFELLQNPFFQFTACLCASFTIIQLVLSNAIRILYRTSSQPVPQLTMEYQSLLLERC